MGGLMVINVENKLEVLLSLTQKMMRNIKKYCTFAKILRERFAPSLQAEIETVKKRT